MTSPNSTKLHLALQRIGKDERLRAKFLSLCRDVERSLDYGQGSIRDDITGPIVDALHSNVGVLHKTLSSGLAFDFYYKSKIARDFVMSDPEIPDHVWEPQTTRLLLHLSKRAKHAIVGGAYFGDQAILMAREMVRNAGVCHAFEPNLEQSEMLIHNAQLNHLQNLRVTRLGLWSDDTSTLTLVGTDAEAHPTVIIQPGVEHQSPSFGTITVDTYLRREGIEYVDLIMLDIEGGEYEALQGAKQQLRLPVRRAPKIIFEIHRNYVDWTLGLHNTEIIKYLSSFGYSTYAIRDFHSNYDMRNKPIELIPPETAHLEGPPHGFNMLATKDLTIIDSNLFKICHGVSPKLLTHKDPRLHHPSDGLS